MGCCNTHERNDGLTKQKIDFVCPRCGENGTLVEKITLESLLIDQVKLKIQTDLDYKYCKNPECEVAYFSRLANKTFTVQDLREKATAKDKGMDVKVCYCFHHTRQSILSELESTGTSTVLADVKAKMKDPGCFCERSNPQGGCCLGNINAWIKEAKAIIEKA